MFEILFFGALGIGAALAALFVYAAVIGVVQANRVNQVGWFHLVPYITFIYVAMLTIAGGRDLTMGSWTLLVSEGASQAAWASWLQRVLTFVFLLVSVERIAAVILDRKKSVRASWLCIAFVLYWCGVVASPSLLGRKPEFSYVYTYTLLVGLAAFTLSRDEVDKFIIATRNAVLLFIAAGVALIPTHIGLVLETTYNQGFIPGLPRMAGLTPHALQLGLVTQVAMLCLWAFPLENKWLNRACWLMCLIVLFVAQSKTAWLSFPIGILALFAVSRYGEIWKWIFNSQRPYQGVLVTVFFMGAILLMSYIILFTSIGSRFVGFFDTSEGANLLTLNGRDQIWEIAFLEWRQSPIFGYGPGFLDFAHRSSIGMLNATHAHNQFVDDLARSGLVGAVSLIFYAAVILMESLRHCKVTQGLSIGLLIVIGMRAVSEVPLSLFGYGAEFVAHLLLLVVLVGGSRAGIGKRGN